MVQSLFSLSNFCLFFFKCKNSLNIDLIIQRLLCQVIENQHTKYYLRDYLTISIIHIVFVIIVSIIFDNLLATNTQISTINLILHATDIHVLLQNDEVFFIFTVVKLIDSILYCCMKYQSLYNNENHIDVYVHMTKVGPLNCAL